MNDVRALFSSIEVIAGLSKVVHEELKKAMDTWHPAKTQIGPIFLKLVFSDFTTFSKLGFR